MGLSRRPARFKKPDFMPTEPNGEEKLEVLRVVGAGVFINEQNPEGESSFQEVNTIVGYENNNVRDEAGNNDNGINLLATVATRLIRKKVEKKLRKLPLPLDLRWRNQKRRVFLSELKKTTP
ncbi:hypothetical protein GLYMA_04G241700v4 [Glycine max]|uniref:Uncharacterized protein n=3 Tax=Glycine subgen. Soja TaxID=1462606 RepID=K7KM32_SOYBN|nr:uncharacterized protein LOC102670276 [Glycine max]XP_028227104.1 uncharacterized protein LOC114408243 [Glycine soja]KAH1112985.1 hypothetical protein GYH30_010947 [Glycine max]KAH1255765.1 hypothetical protein GmHk_04G011829 [Glycine max]KRH64561.1 hypothetical protein GLYMA_04G241700v4 [Glycine max]RZC18137.1 hypothetical protein D0Y65_010678 [Glycine soja]|eukprot:XP_006578944.1 uncharacterized protein LOC102670276 [Glycine max]